MPNYTSNVHGTQALDFASPVTAFIQSFQLARDRKEGKKKEQLQILLAPIEKELADENTSFDRKKELIALLPNMYKSLGFNNKGMEEGFQQIIQYYEHANNNYVGTGNQTEQDVVTVRPDERSTDGGIIDDSITRGQVPEYKRKGELNPNDLKLAFQRKLMQSQSEVETTGLERKLQLENDYKRKFLEDEGFDRSPEKVVDEKGQLWEAWTNPRNKVPTRFVPLGIYSDKMPSGKTVTENTHNWTIRGGKLGAKQQQILTTAYANLGLNPNKQLTPEEEEQLHQENFRLTKLDFDNTQEFKRAGTIRNNKSTEEIKGRLEGTIPPSQTDNRNTEQEERKRVEDYTVKLNEAEGMLEGLKSERGNLSNRRIRAAVELKRLREEQGLEDSSKEVIKANEEMQQIENSLNETNTKIARQQRLVDSVNNILKNSTPNAANAPSNATSQSYSPAETNAITKFRENNKSKEPYNSWTDEQIITYLRNLRR